MWKAFAELEALGFIGPARPRMIAVQAAGCAPFVRAFERGAQTAEPWPDAQTRAAGLRVPAAVGDRLVLAALRESGGTAVAVGEDELGAAQLLAGRLGAGYVGPETGAALAALPVLRERGDLRRRRSGALRLRQRAQGRAARRAGTRRAGPSGLSRLRSCPPPPPRCTARACVAPSASG